MARDGYDAVVIGAGHNSLACAAHLANKGWSVAVFEAAETPGGAVKTGEYTRAGFRHDWAAMNLSSFAGSGFYKQYSDDLAAHGFAFAPVSDCFASVFADGKWFGVSKDHTITTARVAEFSQTDARTWAALSDSFPAEAEHIFGILGSPMKMRALSSILIRLLRKKGLGGSLDLARFLMSSPRQWLDDTFQSEHIKASLAAWGMHLDFAPDMAGGAMFPYLEAMANQAFGMVLGKGGADTMVRAMVSMIKAKGGEVTCDAPVACVLHDGGRASGIELAGGHRIMARRAVIANVAPSEMTRLTGGSGVQNYDRAMNCFSHAPGTMMIHLAMDAQPGWSAGPELQKFAYVHLAPSMDQMARTYQQAKAGLLPDEPVVVVGQPTVADPSRAPAGKHVLWLQVRMAPGSIKGDAAGEITATTWDGAAEPFANRSLEILERYAPGTRKNILSQRVVPPTELEADNRNLVGGDQICGSHHLAQNFLFRPARGYADGSTPIKNLYHTGAAVWPGAGTGAGPGYLLARKLAR